MKYPYEIRHSGRKTLALEITREAKVLIRVPYGVSKKTAEAFLNAHLDWLEPRLEQARKRLEAHPLPDEEKTRELMEKARRILPERTAYYASLMGLSPTAVRFSYARTRFGSCSAKNSISYSCYLMDYPMEAVDYVVVHELAHIRHKNHGKEFYRLVEQYLPDYRERRKLLRS